MKTLIHLFLIGTFLLLLSSCKSLGGNTLNLFPVSKDVELGKQMEHQISTDPKIDIIPRSKSPKAYAMIDDIVNTIKASGKLRHKDDFEWTVYIIKANVLNAFCTPGGYIYVYTGLMKYLDSVDDLAGVIGHEIAHAELRHSTSQMTKLYGTRVMLELLLKEKSNSQLAKISESLLTLKYGRDDEKQADSKSVEYLCDTKYKADSAANFFKKLKSSGQGKSSDIQEFLSTHPNPENRIENITTLAKNCHLSNKSVIKNYSEIVTTL